jgi:hypothetical protein
MRMCVLSMFSCINPGLRSRLLHKASLTACRGSEQAIAGFLAYSRYVRMAFYPLLKLC